MSAVEEAVALARQMQDEEAVLGFVEHLAKALDTVDPDYLQAIITDWDS